MCSEIQIIERTSHLYPLALSELKHPVKRLYVKGQASLLNSSCMAVIGSRKITSYGGLLLKLFIPYIVQAGITVVSGLAYGVDSIGQKMAMDYGGKCLAVLGTGLDKIYPACHHGLSDAIIRSGGALVTEYCVGEKTYKYNFVHRNRIIAGLSKVLLIIEASENSGTLITAQYALECGKEVCVVPADITRTESRGVNLLLKQGARPVTEPKDVLSLFDSVNLVQANLPLRPALTGTSANIYDLIYQGWDETDSLLVKTGLSVSLLQGALAILELDGYIYNDNNNWKITKEK